MMHKMQKGYKSCGKFNIFSKKKFQTRKFPNYLARVYIDFHFSGD